MHAVLMIPSRLQ